MIKTTTEGREIKEGYDRGGKLTARKCGKTTVAMQEESKRWGE